MTRKNEPTPQVDTPSLLLDAYGNPSNVSAGGLIESAWGNAVVGRVTLRFPTVAALNAAAGAEGAIAVVAENNVVYWRESGAWKPTTIGRRVAFRVIGGAPGQPILTATVTRCLWALETSDPNNVLSSGIFTVPAGWAGRWNFEFSVNMSTGAGGFREAWIESGGKRYGMDHRAVVTAAGATSHAGSASIILAVADTAQVNAYLTLDTGIVMNELTDNYFTGYYAGPY